LTLQHEAFPWYSASVNDATRIAILLFAPLAAIGLYAGLVQWRGLKELRARAHVPSDEFAYLRNRHRRRLLVAGLILTISALICTAYLSGLEAKADALAEPAADVPRDADGKRIMSEDDRNLARVWGFYWLGIIVLVFMLIAVAIVDVVAGRRYWAAVYRQLKDDHDVKLRRDLEVYRQAKSQRRGAEGFGGRLGGL
jgi:hypothetical protein